MNVIDRRRRRLWLVWVLALGLGVAAPSAAAAAEQARIEILVMELEKGDAKSIDPRIADRKQLVAMLPQYNRIRVLERLDTQLAVGREVALEFETPSRKKAELRVRLLERTERTMKLRVRCKALQELDTTTTHQEGGTFLVVRPQASVGVAIRRLPDP